MHIIIPARYASSRLPGKPLADICGKTLLERVYQRAVASEAGRVIIATDDPRIQKAAEGFNATVCMTRADHASGTDRIGEVAEKLKLSADEIVINLQGDEPLMPAALIRAVGETLARSNAVMATACHSIADIESFANPNVVKVVCDNAGYATYFSRAPIPWPRDRMANASGDAIQAYRHIGLYAYRAGFIKRYCAWAPAPTERAEQLEQLRVLWYGERIAIHVADEAPGTGVDTPEDLERVRAFFRSGG